MHIGQIERETRRLGGAQGYLPLPVRDVTIDGAPVMVSKWIPSEEDIERISRGEAIYVSILGLVHPPIFLTVGDIEIAEDPE